MTEKKQITIGDILTDSETKRAWKLYEEVLKHNKGSNGPFRSFAMEFCKEVIEPNMERINGNLGQENVPMYLAYLVEHVMSRLHRSITL